MTLVVPPPVASLKERFARRPRVSTGWFGALREALDRPLTSYYLLLGASALLLTIGLIMVLSASSVYSYRYLDGDSYAIVRRQLLWVVLGLPAAFVASRLSTRWLRRFAYGPFEWVWRSLSRAELQPFYRRTTDVVRDRVFFNPETGITTQTVQNLDTQDSYGADVTLLGPQPQEWLARVYAGCDVFAFPSQTETVGNVVAESSPLRREVPRFNPSSGNQDRPVSGDAADHRLSPVVSAMCCAASHPATVSTFGSISAKTRSKSSRGRPIGSTMSRSDELGSMRPRPAMIAARVPLSSGVPDSASAANSLATAMLTSR